MTAPAASFRRVPTDRFAPSEGRRYCRGRQWLLWFWSPTLAGASWWGRPDADDVAEHLKGLDFHSGIAGVPAPGEGDPVDVILDCSGITRLEPAGFSLLQEDLVERMSFWELHVGKLAVLMPDGWVGALTSGFWNIVGPGFEWQCFASHDDAAAWLARDELVAALDAVAAARAEGEGSAAEELRQWLARAPLSPTLASAALDLGRSARTLQRELSAAGTTFRRELAGWARERAEHALAFTDDKVDAIAAELGYPSTAAFSTQFKRWTGLAPTAYREKARAGGQPS